MRPSAGSTCQAKWIPQGWQWVDPEKEFKALLLAMRAGLMSRSEAISAFGYDAEDVDGRSPPTTAAPMGWAWCSTPIRAAGRRRGQRPSQPRANADPGENADAHPSEPRANAPD